MIALGFVLRAIAGVIVGCLVGLTIHTVIRRRQRVYIIEP